MRKPLGMIMVGARVSGLAFMVSYSLLACVLELAFDPRRQGLEALDRAGIARPQQQPVVVRPAAVQNEQQGIDGPESAVRASPAHLVVEVRAGAPARVSHRRQALSPSHLLAGPH